MKMEPRKNHKRALLAAAACLLFVGLACTITFNGIGDLTGKQSGQPTGSSVSDPTICLERITPGVTTREQVLKLLGEPPALQQAGDVEYLFYASSIESMFNSIAIQNQVVGNVSVVNAAEGSPNWSGVKALLGEPAHTTYSNYAQNSMTYVYPERGLAFIADETMNAVFVRECFAPMTLENYLSTWGKNLPAEDPYLY